MALAYHLGIRRLDNAVLAQSRHQRIRLVRSVLQQGRDLGLVVFGLGDHHAHLKTCGTAAEAQELGRRLALSFGRLLRVSTGIVRTFIKPVEGGRYLYTLFRYVLEQPERHGNAVDPSCEGTSLPDLLGLRPAGSFVASAVRALLPRVDRPALLRLAGVSSLAPPTGFQADELLPATLAAAALPELRGHGSEAQDARRAAMVVAEGQLENKSLAELLSIGESTFYRLRARKPVETLVEAIRGQLGLRSRYQERLAATRERSRGQDFSVDAALKR